METVFSTFHAEHYYLSLYPSNQPRPHIQCCLWCQKFTILVVAAANLYCPLPFVLTLCRFQEPFIIFNLIHKTIVVAKIYLFVKFIIECSLCLIFSTVNCLKSPNRLTDADFAQRVIILKNVQNCILVIRIWVRYKYCCSQSLVLLYPVCIDLLYTTTGILDYKPV